MSVTTTQAPSAASRRAIARPMPEPAPVTRATRVASAFGLGIRAELGLLQRPVLDAELLRLVDRRVRRHALGAAHHVDRVDVELAGHPSGLLVGTEGEHADAGDQDDRRVGPADRRAVREGVPVVVGLVVLAVRRVQLLEPGDARRRAARSAAGRARAGRTLVRRKWSGQDVPSAASRGCSAAARKSRTTAESVKWPTCGRSVEARPRTTGSRAAARSRRSASGSASNPGTTGPNGSGRPRSDRKVSAVRMISSERASHSSDVAPHAVTPWPPRMQPIASGFFAAISAMSRPSWKPGRRHGTHTTRSPKHSRVRRLAVGRGGQRDAGVRVQVVDVGGGHEAVHGCVDRRSRAALAVQAVVERGDHLVLAVDAGVDVDQGPQRGPGAGRPVPAR